MHQAAQSLIVRLRPVDSPASQSRYSFRDLVAGDFWSVQPSFTANQGRTDCHRKGWNQADSEIGAVGAGRPVAIEVLGRRHGGIRRVSNGRHQSGTNKTSSPY